MSENARYKVGDDDLKLRCYLNIFKTAMKEVFKDLIRSLGSLRIVRVMLSGVAVVR